MNYSIFLIILIASQCWDYATAVCSTSLCPYLRNYWPIYIGLPKDVVAGADLTSSSPAFAADQFGNTDSALHITGSSSIWTAPSSNYFSSDYSFTAWIKPNGYDRWARIFDFGNPSTNDTVFFAYCRTGVVQMGFNVLTMGSKGADPPTYTNLTIGTWYHVAVSVTGTTGNLYLNGALLYTVNMMNTTRNILRTQNLIGGSYWNPPVGVDGYANMDIDQIKIYTIALSQDQIQADMSFTSYSACLYGSLNAYWPIQSGTAKDLIAGADLASSTPTFTADRFSMSSEALLINSASNYWYAPPGYYFTSTSATVTAWVYPTQFINWARVLDFGNPAASDFIGLMYSYDSNGQPTFSIGGSGQVNQLAPPPTAISLNTWTHLGLVLDGVNLRFFINGAQVFTFTMSIPINVMNRTQNYIGKSYYPSDPASQVYVDEIKIYNRALRAQEVEFDYRAGTVLSAECQLSSIVVVGATNGLNFLDSKTGGLIKSVTTGSSTAQAVTYVSANYFAVATSSGLIKVYEATQFQLIKTISVGVGIIEMVLVAPDAVVVALSDSSCRAFNLTSALQISTFTQHNCAPAGLVAMSNGKIGSFAGEYVYVWDWRATSSFVTIRRTQGIFPARQISNEIIAVGDNSGLTTTWSVSNGTQLSITLTMPNTVAEIISYSAEIVITSDTSGNLYVWSWRNATRLSMATSGPANTLQRLRLTQDGYLVATSWGSSRTRMYSLSSTNTLTMIWSYSGPSYGVLPMSTLQLGPQLTILDKYPFPQSPLNQTRSITTTFTATYLFICPYPYSATLQWKVYKLDTTTFAVVSEVTLVNPTMSTLAFTLPGNTLDYGVYKVEIALNISVDSITMKFSAQDATYLQISPSGIIVSVMANSLSNITIGSSQALVLSPVLYSSDLDNLVTMSSLSFKFYCHQVNDSFSGVNFLLTTTGNVDMATGVTTNDCFASSSGYYFNQSGNALTVKPAGFKYTSGTSNQFVISTTSSGYTYYQTFNVVVIPGIPSLPVLAISCRVPSFCTDLGSVKIFSTSNIMIMEGSYTVDTIYVDSVTLTWTVTKNTGNITNPVWTALTTSEKSNLMGVSTTELTISSNLFSSSILQYKLQFTITITSSSMPSLNGDYSANLILQTNQKPYNGSCSVNLNTGYALDTNFIITCINWADLDGIVTKYEFFASFTNNASIVNLGNNQTGFFNTTLPAGLSTDSNKLYLFVQVFDNSGGITPYYITTSVVVEMKTSTLLSSQADILSGASSSPLVQSMKSADLSVASSAIIAYASSFNQIASTDNSSSSSSNTSNSSLSTAQVEFAKEVNSMFVESMTNYDLTDLSSIKAASSVLSVVSANAELLSPSTAEKIGDLCAQMTDNLLAGAPKYSLTYIYQAASFIIDASANGLESLNQQSSNSAQLQAAAAKQISLVQSITSMTSKQLAVNGSQNVNKQNINLTITRTSMDTVASDMSTGGNQIAITNPCSIVGKPEGNCSDGTVISQVFSRTNSLVLNTDLNTKGSGSVSVSYFDTDMKPYSVSNVEDGFYFWISVSIDQKVEFVTFNASNATISSTNQLQTFILDLSSSNQAVTILLNPTVITGVGYLMSLKYGKIPVISSSSQAFDLIKVYCPWDLQTLEGKKVYKMFSNMAANTISTKKVGYGFRQLSDDEYAKYCVSGVTIQVSQAPVLPDSSNFTGLVSLEVSRLVYASGCYFIDETTVSYSSVGVEVLPDSNSTHTHCVATHLTEFVGGLIILPDAIDFENVWANADFTKNMTIYLTVIIVCSLYIVLFVICRYMDWKDNQRRRLYFLEDNVPTDLYFYEMIVFTGGRQNAGTLSRVCFMLGGDLAESGNRKLKARNSKNRILQRGAIDSFVLSTQDPLGQLQYLRIWHDNSGPGRFASWFLKFIIVHDLQTREKFYFICNNWLAVEKSDGSIDRMLSVATSKQKTDLKYLMEKQTKEKLSDGHLWFSIVARPTESSFNRTDRLTCAFVLLCLTMLMNIMYYGMASSSSGNELVVGPFSLSQAQIVIGVITNLVVFPPSFLLLQIFRKSRRRKTRSMKLKEHITEVISGRTDLEFNEDVKSETKRKSKKLKKQFTLPWWFKIIGYLMSAAMVGVCIFFIIVKGISFGDDLCRKWLTSFVISVLTSIFLTQPIQVALLSIFFVLLFRKANDDKDLEYDFNDDGKPINKIKFKQIKKNTTDEDDTVVNLKKLLDRNNEIMLMEMKKKKEIENKTLSMLKQILIYAIFLSVLFQVSYSKTNPVSYKYQTQLQGLLLPNLTRVQTTDQIYNWLKTQFMPAMIGSLWYNQDSTDLSKYLKDYNSMLVGSILIRQSRVLGSSCSRITGKKVCYSDYGVSNYDHSDYNAYWTDYSSTSSGSYSDTVEKAFTYSTASSLNSKPYAGLYGNYLGGGYAFQIDTSVTNLTGCELILDDLQKAEWINEKTRALFVEFTVYNVNADLFSYCTILFEVLSTGSIVISYEFDPISLFTDDSIVIVAFDILYLFITVFMVLKEIKLMIKLRKKYLTEWWSYFNWIIVIFSWVAFSMYLYRMYEKSDLMKKIKANDGQVANFQTINYWTNLMLMFLAFCCFFASVKLLKVFSFSRNVSMLMRVFSECFKEMLGFIIIYIILMLAFTQSMYLMVYDRNAQFMSFATSLVTGFLMIIGKFNVDSFIHDTGNILGPLIYCVFSVSMILILLNMFITLMTNQFSQIRNDYREQHKDEDSLILTYLKSNVWPSVMKIVKPGKNKYKQSERAEMKDSIDLLEDKTIQLVYKIDATAKD